MFSKALIATLIIASAALAQLSPVNARPAEQRFQHQQQQSDETNWMDRASKNYDGGGY